MKHLSWTVFLTLAVLLCGCTSIQMVPVKRLKTLQPGQSKAMVLQDQKGRPVRLGANAKVRFVCNTGEKTKWVSARKLLMSKQGVHIKVHLPLHRAIRIQFQQLGPEARAFLQQHLGTQLDTSSGPNWVLHVTPRLPVGWLRQLFVTVAIPHATPTDLRWYKVYHRIVNRAQDRAHNPEMLRRYQASVQMYESRMVHHYFKVTGGKSLGLWNVSFPGASNLSLQGPELLRSWQHGVQLYDTLSWKQIHAAQIENLHGPKTLGAIVGTAALAVVIAPFTFALRGLGGASRGSSGGSGFTLAARGIEAAAGAAVSGAAKADRRAQLKQLNRQTKRQLSKKKKHELGKSEGFPTGQGLAQGHLQTPGRSVQSLFTPFEKRRSLFQFVAALDSGVDFIQPNGMESRVFLGFRISEFFTIGGGLRMSWNNLFVPGFQAVNSRPNLEGFFRMGVHLELEPSYRVAFPLSVDLGGGNATTFYMRLNAGIRVRIWRSLHVGLYPFNPTLTLVDPEQQPANPKPWSFPTTIEFGGSF